MWSSHATRRPIAYQGLHPRQPHRAAVVHTNGGPCAHGSLYGWWTSHADGSMGSGNLHLGAHFQVPWDGHGEQYVDTDLVVYHAYSASEFAVGFEVQDDGDPTRPMTDAQIRFIVDVCRELGVPGRLLADGPSDGVGYHEQYPDWNRSGHTCPGAVRRQQVIDRIVPALVIATPHITVSPAAPREGELNETEHNALIDAANRLGNIQKWMAERDTGTNARLAKIEADVEAIKKKVGA